MILMIDHHDSFTYNIVHYLESLNETVITKTIDELTIEEIKALHPSHIILSPGPGHPDDAKLALDVLHHFAGAIPILGVCLGFQVIMRFYHHEIAMLSPVHGHQVPIYHTGDFPFKGLSSPTLVARYHSLGAIGDVQSPLVKTAWTKDNIVMGVRHITLPVYGIQFHPESILTTDGLTMLETFIRGV
ncbi:anthranilate synthase component II [Macrococcoides caseolyticum]|uniref:anthranilate synthase component II n=1 Tax=Macrococcoides caseolyticum TaxID=69966 RepID=UPI001F3645AB|nr:aminodeoxychorismate/anthranilate synthase component II [Macrococcus caseolyticus]MCE4955885.1 aminodeoxychorismate/anthranilate synthase component II [Macrococcus caseolyticus]